MRAVELAVLNLREVRRRASVVWRAVPDGLLNWQPDEEALSMGEMIRHMWAAQVYYHEVLKAGNSVHGYRGPYDDRPVLSVEEELSLSRPCFEQFIDYVLSLSDEELSDRMVDRSDVGYIRSVGDMLARIAYHESVHTGQLLQYMRMAGIDRPQIWD